MRSQNDEQPCEYERNIDEKIVGIMPDIRK